MRDTPVDHLSQSAMRSIKLLKQEMPRLVREVQWSQVNVKKSPPPLPPKKKHDRQPRDFIREVKSMHYATIRKRSLQEPLQWLLQKITPGTPAVALTKDHSRNPRSGSYKRSLQEPPQWLLQKIIPSGLRTCQSKSTKISFFFNCLGCNWVILYHFKFIYVHKNAVFTSIEFISEL